MAIIKSRDYSARKEKGNKRIFLFGAHCRNMSLVPSIGSVTVTYNDSMMPGYPPIRSTSSAGALGSKSRVTIVYHSWLDRGKLSHDLRRHASHSQRK